MVRANLPRTATIHDQTPIPEISQHASIAVAMSSPEDWALKLIYRDKNDHLTTRFVSPIRYLGPERFLALCLCREEPRQFYLNRCVSIQLVPACTLTMPMPMETRPENADFAVVR